MKKKILVTYCVPEIVFEPYKDEFDITVPDRLLTRDDVLACIGEYDGLFALGQRLDKEMLDAAKNLKAAANNGVGYDNFDVKEATKRGVAVINTPTAVTEATAEHAATLALAVMRGIVRYDKQVRAGGWERERYPDHNSQIYGSTVGIVGFGRIGKRVCKKLQGFGMEVMYYDPYRAAPEVEEEYGVRYVELDELIRTAEVITLHMPYTPENHHLINAETFDKMRKDAYLVNAARGAVVDEAALIEALREHKIKGAALDVFEHEPHPMPELFELDNVILTPHIASAVYKTRIGMAKEAMEGLTKALRGEKPYNLVNPEIWS